MTPPSLVSDMQASEQQLVVAVRAKQPERVDRDALPDPNLVLQKIGVTFLSPDRPEGYLRLFPQDFIVEEILPDGHVVEILQAEPFDPSIEDTRTLWADLIKANLSGPHAVADLQHLLGLDSQRIGYAGMKDAVAVTSQRVTLRGVTKEQAEAVESKRLFLRPVRYGNGVLQPGNLKGNRFTLTIRCQSDAPIDTAMQALAQHGFLNFFGPQRFGPRLNSHIQGKLILQNDVEGAIRSFMCEPGSLDLPLYRDLRLAMNECFGNWQAMLEIAQHFPFTMRDELTMLRALIVEPKKTRYAMSLIKDEIKMLVNAYSSWLINRYLSHLVQTGAPIPAEIPLPFSPNGPLMEYRDMMAEEGTLSFMEAMAQYPYLQTSTKTIPAKIMPEGLRWEKIPQGWVVRFSLNKGAYATSCLSHVFRLYEGLPVPPWVQREEVDGFAVIHEGSIETIKPRLGTAMTRRDGAEQSAEGQE